MMICLIKNAVKGGVSLKKGNFGHFFAILGDFQPATHPYSAKIPKFGMECVPTLFLNAEG